MKFSYEYRTSDNARHTGVVDAPNREAAFQSLKTQGIRPGRLAEAPGFFNKLFGKGKRWLAIAVLGAGCLVLGAIVLNYSHQAQGTRHQARYAAEDRAQIFGDPSVIQKLAHNGWRDTFPDAGEAWLARHAIPGKVCDCPEKAKVKGEGEQWNVIASALLTGKDKPIAILDGDSEELKKMKRMVNGMKREFAEYAETPPDAVDYVNRCCERCRVEKGIAENIARELAGLERQLEKPEADRAKILSDWDKKNATLRSLGLSTIPQPE